MINKLMDDETLAALKASIKHWADNSKAETPKDARVDAAACALCRLYLEHDCFGCPVAEKTGNKHCHGSPYWAAQDAWGKWYADIGNGDTFRTSAAAERDFLINLLPWLDKPFFKSSKKKNSRE